jgi:hypothetical protein
MCTTEEIMNTSNPPKETQASFAWVRPVIVGAAGNTEAVDSFGRELKATLWSCSGWSDESSSVHGYLMRTTFGRFFVSSCDGKHRIACCAPVEPEP